MTFYFYVNVKIICVTMSYEQPIFKWQLKLFVAPHLFKEMLNFLFTREFTKLHFLHEVLNTKLFSFLEFFEIFETKKVIQHW